MVVLITGASGGLGKVLGNILVNKGMTVYGTTRNPEGKQQDFPFTLLALEATSDESVDACVNQVLEREGRIDVLINCVNEMIIGSVEEETVEEVENLYRTNIFGVLRICKRVIPAMRKRGYGTIVNMSSLGGLLAVPYMGAYTSAKFALEALSEGMYHELKPHNIDVVIMQPVAMYMERSATGNHLHPVKNVDPGSFTHKIVALMAEDTAASKLTPEMVANKIYRVITSDKKPLRVPMDRSKTMSIVKRLAPQKLIDNLIGQLLKRARDLTPISE